MQPKRNPIGGNKGAVEPSTVASKGFHQPHEMRGVVLSDLRNAWQPAQIASTWPLPSIGIGAQQGQLPPMQLQCKARASA
jgi:hypothetical protein